MIYGWAGLVDGLAFSVCVWKWKISGPAATPRTHHNGAGLPT
jgi:hypothetical protein